MKEVNKLFKAPRWNNYQDVEVLKTKVNETADDKKKIDNFRKFIDNEILKEQGTKTK